MPSVLWRRSSKAKMIDSSWNLSVSAPAEKLAKSQAARPQLLTMNLYDMEARCCLECLTRFKHSYWRGLENMKRILLKLLPEMTGGRNATSSTPSFLTGT